MLSSSAIGASHLFYHHQVETRYEVSLRPLQTELPVCLATNVRSGWGLIVGSFPSSSSVQLVSTTRQTTSLGLAYTRKVCLWAQAQNHVGGSDDRAWPCSWTSMRTPAALIVGAELWRAALATMQSWLRWARWPRRFKPPWTHARNWTQKTHEWRC